MPTAAGLDGQGSFGGGGNGSFTPYNKFGSGAGVTPATSGPPTATASPGSFSVDTTTPQALGASMANNVTEAVQYTQGLNAAIFGTHVAGTGQENQGGIPILSDIGRAVGRVPVLGQLAGGVGDLVGGIGDTLKNAGDVVGGAFENVMATPQDMSRLQQQYDTLPTEAKTAVADKVAASTSDAEKAHLMFTAVNDFNKSEAGREYNPTLFPETTAAAVTLADHLTQALDLFQSTVRPVERTIAGMGKPGEGGLDRLDEIDGVMRGTLAFTADHGATPVEKVAWQNWSSGVWSKDQALDFLSAAHTGLSHDTAIELVGGVVLDPQVWGSVGASAFTKLGMVGERLVAEGLQNATLTKQAYGTIIAGASELSAEDGTHLFQTAVNAAKAAKVSGPGELPPDTWNVIGKQFGLDGGMAEALVDHAAAMGGPISPVNVLGYIGRNHAATDFMRVIGGTVRSVQTQKQLGAAAAIARAIIDPFHYIGGLSVLHNASVGVLSEAAPRIVDDAIGQLASTQIAEAFHAIHPGLGLDDRAGYAVNMARKVLGTNYLDTQIAAAKLNPTITEDLASAVHAGTIDINQIVDAADKVAPKSLFDALKLKATEVRPVIFDSKFDNNLAMRLHAAYSGMGNGPTSVEEWYQWLAGRSNDFKAGVHAMVHQNLANKLSEAVHEASLHGLDSTEIERLRGIYLMNRDTLTTAGAQGILDRMSENAANLVAQQEEMLASQKLYPELRGLAQFHEVSPSESVQAFINALETEVRNGRYPTQLLDNEIAALPAEVQEVDRLISGTYTLAMRPVSNDALMGLSRDASGNLFRAYDPWLDQIGNGTVKAHGTFATEHNILGLPLLGQPVGKTIDYLEAGLRTAKAMVQTEQIAVRATQRFQTLANERYGMTAADSKALIEAVQNAAHAKEITVRGLSASNMQAAVRNLLPLGTRMTPADILNLTLEAYEGDLRYVGLTQKFTGIAKKMFGKTGVNFAGQLSEDLYQKIRFNYNYVFQAQERVEPWVLSAQRGVMPIFGTKMSAEDRLFAHIAQNLRDTGVMRAASIDQAEWAAYAVAGSDMRRILAREVDPGLFSELMDTRGSKFTNLNRVAAESATPHVREALDRSMPGFFDAFRDYTSARLGRPINDVETVAHWFNEGGLANEIQIPDIIEPGIGAKTFEPHIRVGQMMTPVDIGEMRDIPLDFWARRLALTRRDGTVITDENGIRRALADPQSGLDNSSLRTALLEHGAHPTQADRVVNALNFNYQTFFNNLQTRFNLTGAERVGMENFIGRAAALRGVSPGAFMSQIFSPTIRGGSEASMGALGAAVDVMRAGRTVQVPDLAQLAARSVDGVWTSTREDLITQLSQVFAHHLDPSSKWALLQELRPELFDAIRNGSIGTDMETLDRMWDEGAQHWLAQGIMHNTAEATITDDAADFMARYPGPQRPMIVKDAETGDRLPNKVTGSLGPGLLAVPERVRGPLVRDISEFRTTVPDVHIRYDVVPLHEADPAVSEGEAIGATYRLGGRHTNQYNIHLDSSMFGEDSAAQWAREAHMHALGASRDSFPSLGGGPRQSYYGAPYDVSSTPRGLVYHEGAHAVAQDIARRAAAEPAMDALDTKLNGFLDSPAARQLSEMAVFNPAEAKAEVLGAALDPQFDIEALRRRSIIPPTTVMAESRPVAAAEDVPVRVEQFYDHTSRNWVTRLVNSDGTQVGDAYYDGTRADAAASRGYAETELAQHQQAAPAAGVVGAPDRTPLRGRTGQPNTLSYENYARPNAQPLHEVVYYGPDGQAHGYAMFSGPTTEGGMGLPVVYVDPEFRRQGVASRMYDELRQHAPDLRGSSGKITTEEGQAFTEAYWSGARDVRPPNMSGPQNAADFVEELRQNLIDAGILHPIDPGSADMQRAAQMFGRFTTSAVRDGLLNGSDSRFASILNDVARIPTKDAVPYNLAHGLMVQQVEDAMLKGSEDAFRLNFFKQNRSWAERSLNHPFFGIYPASYMWGKILPELARFMFKSPFGVRTGAAAYVARDMANQLAVKQELDPDFQKMLAGMDKSQILWFLGYLLPALPWDVGSAAPTWSRELAKQGLDNQARVDAGLAPKPIDLTTPLGKVGDYVSPFRQVTQVEKPLNELGQDIYGSAKQQKQNAQQSYTPPPTSAEALPDPLAAAQQSLRDLFSR